MAVTHSFSNIWSSVIPQDQNVGCELHKEVELKAYRKIYVALRAVYYFPFIKNNPVYSDIILLSCQLCCLLWPGLAAGEGVADLANNRDKSTLHLY